MICGLQGLKRLPLLTSFATEIGQPCMMMHMFVVLRIRYLLYRCSEFYNINISFAPKPMKGDWNGAGCHANFSTKGTRSKDSGAETIKKMLIKLEMTHKKHISAYGEGNEERLTGKHETASMEQFSFGIADRGSSIRIPTETHKKGCGYFEDRRPAANCCPYIVTRLLVETCCGDIDLAELSITQGSDFKIKSMADVAGTGTKTAAEGKKKP
mmetsp:Transcript_16330/g.26508  ORF Transcript_16330/g.26508 Transcript_16330/m.26508 type:complete len:212 (-) Transcript_16330:140-775(-)